MPKFGTMPRVLSDLKNNHWSENLELACLTAMLVAIPFSSGVTLAVACLWLLVVMVKNSLLKRWSFFGLHQDKFFQHYHSPKFLYLMMAYWLMYLLSMLWTQNQAEGWAEVGSLACFAVFPLIYAITDFRQVKKEHFRLMFWLFVVAMSGLFVVRFALVASRYNPAEDTFIWYMLTQANEFYIIHHSYMALYLLTGLAFLYSEIWKVKQSEKKRLMITLLIVCTCCLVLFLLCINSRAGLLCLLLMVAMCWAHLAFVRKMYKLGAVSLVVVVLLAASFHFMLPEHFRNLSTTVTQLVSGDTSDGRIEIMGNAFQVVKENPLLGVGAGDRLDVLRPFYATPENPNESFYNPHNQYLDTWMTTGVVGLLLMLALMLVPMVYAWHRKNIFMLLTIMMIAVSMLFESMLERQMGYVFVALIMTLFAIDGEKIQKLGCQERRNFFSVFLTKLKEF